jgi:hypothetical protein
MDFHTQTLLVVVVAVAAAVAVVVVADDLSLTPSDNLSPLAAHIDSLQYCTAAAVDSRLHSNLS